MTLLVLDPATDAGPWQAKAADGSPSTLVHVTADPAPQPAIVIDAAAGATGHFIERALPAPTDLGATTDIQLWLTSDRAATGTDAHPFFLELRIGSTAAPISAQNNLWHRYLPAAQRNTRELSLLSLSDLPAQARTAVSTIRFTCTEGSAPFTSRIERITALAEHVLADIDAALKARLDGKITANGAPVPALIAETGAALPNPPYVRITNFDVRTADERSPQAPTRSDYSEGGFSLRPPRATFDALYEVECIADDRATEAAALEFLLADMAPRTALDVNDWPMTCELIPIPAALGATRPDRVVIWLRVLASVRRTGIPQPAQPPTKGADLTLGQAPTTAALA
ncbi:MAG TPA: hypothetical protein VMU39_11000 [Solirubrobacteraceae bacterium]|nr:hypothetical protein [Solirubrobacteraceae bacterium]